MKLKFNLIFLFTTILLVAYPETAFCDVEGILRRTYTTIVGGVFPLLAMIYLLYSCFLLYTGNPAGRENIKWAIIATFIGFMSKSIIQWVAKLAGNPGGF